MQRLICFFRSVCKLISFFDHALLGADIGNFVWASGSGGKVGGSRKKLSGRERGAEGQVRLLRARGSAELGEVASGSATQGLWLRNRKVGSQVSGVDRSRLYQI